MNTEPTSSYKAILPKQYEASINLKILDLYQNTPKYGNSMYPPTNPFAVKSS